jgi:hypothetical protein
MKIKSTGISVISDTHVIIQVLALRLDDPMW